jgi:hypothetical protein
MRGAQSSHLLGLLQRNEMLKARGFSLNPTHPDSIVIDRAGHVHGIWEFDGRQYAWRSPCSTEPVFRTASPSAAVVYTLIALAQT